ncbi:cell wall-binding repeat-containing protein [Clostridium cochlearium]|uniref:Cell wall-binding repeat-containing protein n=1 Tax=Clostridium cochlearium TaxID=1494 RepID=A0A7Y3V7C7_CLOCO|nr:cell wall-binding repeat-containing protein [Clostridium cochlearium]NOH16078.1 cell wall-binding repeat-containing protein [Clostridium cochlearium]
MSKNSHKALASATVMSLVLTSTLAATNVQAAAEVTRMPGADRYTTAQTVAKKSFGKAENVVLVNGLGYADSVSATPFAKLKNAPILLTDAEDKPSADLTATLTELGAKNIYIVGGKGVVTEAMEKELAKNYKVERIGGNSRYETNAEIAKKVIAETKAEKAILVNGQDGYADALSVASVAATKGYPVIFGNKNNVPTVVKDAVKGVKEVLAVGGEGVLPDAVIKTVEAKRIAKGADRFDTNLKVLEHFNADFNFDNIFVAAGGDDSTSKFADALVASAAAAKHGAPVVLTGLGANKDNVDKSVKYIKDKMGDNTKVTIVGGTASVSDSIEKDIKGEKESTGKAEVQSIEALNLNQVKVVFGSKVDEDSAEDVTNYEVDGKQLDEDIAKAVLKDDDRTLILTLADEQEQHDEITVKVRKGVLSEDKTKNVKEYEKDIVFKDLVAPTISKISVRGNSKLTVEFSEAIYVDGDNDDVEAAKRLAEKFEINGQSIDSMGLDNKYTKVKDSLKLKNGGYYVNKVDFYFTSPLDAGTNELKVLAGEKNYILCDAAGFTVQETTKNFKVDEVTSKPKVKSIKGGSNGKIYIDFDRAMDAETAQIERNFKLNDEPLSENNAEVELKKEDTQVKITVDSGLVKTGSNVVEILDKVKDAYGNKIEEDTRVSFKAEKDDVKPKVASVTSIDANTIRVRFTEDVRYNHAVNESNYELKDSKGTNITDEYFETNAISAANGKKDKDTDVYDIKLKKELTSKKYTLKIENIADTSDNVMDDYTATFNGEDDEAPYVKKAVKKITKSNDGSKVTKYEVIVQFSEDMNKTTLRKAENYRYIDNEGKVKDIPSKATISVASDNKTASIEFPTSYSEKVNGIIVKSAVEDLAGNKMEADYRKDDIEEGSLGIELKLNSFKFAEPSDDEAEIKMEFTGAVQSVNASKFTFKDVETGETVKAVSPRISGEEVTFKFSESDGAKKIKTFGSDLAVSFEKGAVIDKAGGEVLAQDVVKVYNNNIEPKLDVETSGSYVTNWKAGNKSVTIKFNTKINKDLKDSYKNDFEFRNLDTSDKLNVEKVEVNGAEITYTFEENIDNIKEINVVAKKDNIDIRTVEDRAGDDKKYVPAKEDISGRKFKVKDAKDNQTKEEAAKNLDEAKKALQKAEEDAKDYKEVEDVKTALEMEAKTLDQIKAKTTAINEAVKEAKEAETEAKALETAKKEFNDLKATITDLEATTEASKFKIGSDEYTIFADEKNNASEIDKGIKFATVSQAKAIKTAMEAEVKGDSKDVKALTEKLKQAIDAVKNQVGTKEA